MSVSGKQFGQRKPPLSVSIRQILERYPDGQIFKVCSLRPTLIGRIDKLITYPSIILLQEMIQNADDAGASIVQFYVDCRQHGTRTRLVKPELAAYQGPALISSNDAGFSDEDWEGIQRLQQSIKANDPFKVGRFGIGFNSVYHLTGESRFFSVTFT